MEIIYSTADPPERDSERNHCRAHQTPLLAYRDENKTTRQQGCNTALQTTNFLFTQARGGLPSSWPLLSCRLGEFSIQVSLKNRDAANASKWETDSSVDSPQYGKQERWFLTSSEAIRGLRRKQIWDPSHFDPADLQLIKSSVRGYLFNCSWRISCFS